MSINSLLLSLNLPSLVCTPASVTFLIFLFLSLFSLSLSLSLSLSISVSLTLHLCPSHSQSLSLSLFMTGVRTMYTLLSANDSTYSSACLFFNQLIINYYYQYYPITIAYIFDVRYLPCFTNNINLSHSPYCLYLCLATENI